MPGLFRSTRGHTRRRAASSVAVAALTAAAAFAGAASLAATAGSAGAATAGSRPAATRIGSVVALPAGARALGALPSSTSIHVDVVLEPRNSAALQAFATAVSTPGSPLFRHFLAKGAFATRFGPTSAAIAAVEASLRAEGLRPSAISANHLIIPVTATAGHLSTAFSVAFERYEVGGRVAYASTSAPRFASEIAPYILGVVGLDDIYLLHHQPLFQRHVVGNTGRVRFARNASGPKPCGAAAIPAAIFGAYTADKLASAYGFTSLYTAGDLGAGQTVALFELEKNLPTDIAKYQTCYATSAKVTYVKVDGGSKGPAAGQGEAALDIEDIIGLAPKAAVRVYQGPNSNTGLLDVYNKIATDDIAKVMSSSWGQCESQSGATIMNAENKIFQQAAAQGQSLFAAAGDSGSTDCVTKAGIQNKVEADDPASNPFITGVGGTTLKKGVETVWNESKSSPQPAGSGGGGVSSFWTMPSFQSGAPSSLNVINKNSSGTQCKAGTGKYCREEPDVSANADPLSGYMIYFTGTGGIGWTPIGGTSAASPLWAAFLALTNADPACKGPVGFTNPALYAVAAKSYKTTFNDITSGNNDYTPSGYTGGLYPAGTAYDMASGLGSPIGGPLAAALCALGGSSGHTVTVANPGTQKTAVGAKVSLPIKASDSSKTAKLTYSAQGLPAGLKISTTGLITGSPKTKGTSTVTVTARDSSGAKGTTKFTWVRT